MKRRLSFIIALTLTLILTSCTVSDVNVTIDSDVKKVGDDDKNNTSTSEKTDLNDNSVTPEKAAPVTDEKEATLDAKSETELLNLMNMTTDENRQIEDIAVSFLNAVKDGDKKAVADYAAGNAEFYDFIEDLKVTDFDLTPIKSVDEEYSYSSDYICSLESQNGSETRYYLSVEDTGDSVRLFMPLETAVCEINQEALNIPDQYRYFASQFVNTYYFLLNADGLEACDIDFSDYNGYHFIPHLMNYLYEDWGMPHSMTEINEFIAKTFYENSGVTLSSPQDYELWISDGEYTGTSSDPNDKIYGCFRGHGGNWIESVICGYESGKGGVKVTIQTYADKIKFAKSRKIVLNFAGEIEGEAPLLYSAEVLDDTGLAEALGSV